MTKEDNSLGERIAKLPAWAQNHIADLASRVQVVESQMQELETALQAGPDDSDVFAEVSDVTRPLGKSVVITFGSGADVYTASLSDGALHVEGIRDLTLEPASAYAVVLRLKN